VFLWGTLCQDEEQTERGAKEESEGKAEDAKQEKSYWFLITAYHIRDKGDFS